MALWLIAHGPYDLSIRIVHFSFKDNLVERKDITEIALEFVCALANSYPLRIETAESFEAEEPAAIFARIVTDALKLSEPIDVADVGRLKYAMATTYKNIRRVNRLAKDILTNPVCPAYHTGKGDN